HRTSHPHPHHRRPVAARPPDHLPLGRNRRRPGPRRRHRAAVDPAPVLVRAGPAPHPETVLGSPAAHPLAQAAPGPVGPPYQSRRTTVRVVPCRDLRRGLRRPHRRTARRVLRPRRPRHPQYPLVATGDHRHHPPRHPRRWPHHHLPPARPPGRARPGPRQRPRPHHAGNRPAITVSLPFITFP